MAEPLEFRLRATDDSVIPTVQRVAGTVAQLDATAQRLTSALTRTTTVTDHLAMGVGRLGQSVATAAAKGQAWLAQWAGVDQGLRQTTQTAGHTTASVDRMTTSLAGSLKQGLATAAGMLGFQGVTSVMGHVVGSMVTFEAKMANVNTLVQGNTALQTKLRTELLQLPPVLGSSTSLAEGLYAALSAGIEPGKAVAFVGEAAKTAKAGLTDMETSVNTLASVMAAYGIKTQDVTRVSDLLFQTVNVGKGTFSEFARAFAVVSPLANTMGISLKEVSATLGTLSFAFPTAAEGGEAFRSILSNLIQHGEKFRAIGIDVQKVISEEGLTGLFRRLHQATRGNVESIRELLPDVTGLSAALAAMGPHAEKQAQNLEAMEKAAGSTAQAFAEQSKTLESSWKEFIGSLDRFAQEAAPTALSALKTMVDGMTGAVQQFKKDIHEMKADDPKGFFAEIGQSAKDAWASVANFAIDNEWRGVKNLLSLLGQGAQALSGLSTATQIIEKRTVDTFGQAIPDTLERETLPAVEKVVEGIDKVTPAVGAATAAAVDFGTEGKRSVEKVRDAVEELINPLGRLKTSWEILGITSQKVLRETAMEAANAFKFIAGDANNSALTVQQAYEAMREKVIAAYGTLPPEFQRIDEAIKAGNFAAARAMIENWDGTIKEIPNSYNKVPAAMQPGHDGIIAGVTGTATAITDVWRGTVTSVMISYDQTLQAIRDLNDATGQGIRTAAEQTIGAVVGAATQARVIVDSVVQSAEQRIAALSDFMTARFGQWQGFQTPFADTEAGILEQIRGFQESMNKLREPGVHHMIPGYVEWQLKQWNDAIILLYQKLADLVARQNRNLVQQLPGTGLGDRLPLDLGMTPGLLGGGIPLEGFLPQPSQMPGPTITQLPPREPAPLVPVTGGTGGGTGIGTPGWNERPIDWGPHVGGSRMSQTFQIDVRYTGVQNARQLVNDIADEINEQQRRGRFRIGSGSMSGGRPG